MKKILKKIISLAAKIMPISWCRFFQKTALFSARILQQSINEKSRSTDDIFNRLAQGFLQTTYQRYAPSSLKEKNFTISAPAISAAFTLLDLY